jgi:hypothetical protein
VVYNGEFVRAPGMRLVLLWESYFADNVRDDYAAGQLDAQVSVFLVR